MAYHFRGTDLNCLEGTEFSSSPVRVTTVTKDRAIDLDILQEDVAPLSTVLTLPKPPCAGVVSFPDVSQHQESLRESVQESEGASNNHDLASQPTNGKVERPGKSR